MTLKTHVELVFVASLRARWDSFSRTSVGQWRAISPGVFSLVGGEKREDDDRRLAVDWNTHPLAARTPPPLLYFSEVHIYLLVSLLLSVVGGDNDSTQLKLFFLSPFLCFPVVTAPFPFPSVVRNSNRSRVT